MVVEGKKRWIPDQTRFFAMGYGHRDVSVLSPSVVDPIPEGLPLIIDGIKDGDFIRPENKPEVYLVSKGKRRWITTQEILFGAGASHESVIVLPQSLVNKLPEGEKIN